MSQATLLQNPLSQWISLTIHYDVVAAQQQKFIPFLAFLSAKSLHLFFPGIMVALKVLL